MAKGDSKPSSGCGYVIFFGLIIPLLGWLMERGTISESTAGMLFVIVIVLFVIIGLWAKRS